jgi:hypothetical protein
MLPVSHEQIIMMSKAEQSCQLYNMHRQQQSAAANSF